MVFDQNGELLAHGNAFDEDLLVTDLNLEALYLARLHSPLRRAEMLEYHMRDVEEIDVAPAATASKPPLKPVATSMLRDEMILVYPYAWVGIVQPSGDYEVSRCD